MRQYTRSIIQTTTDVLERVDATWNLEQLLREHQPWRSDDHMRRAAAALRSWGLSDREAKRVLKETRHLLGARRIRRDGKWLARPGPHDPMPPDLTGSEIERHPLSDYACIEEHLPDAYVGSPLPDGAHIELQGERDLWGLAANDEPCGKLRAHDVEGTPVLAPSLAALESWKQTLREYAGADPRLVAIMLRREHALPVIGEVFASAAITEHGIAPLHELPDGALVLRPWGRVWRGYLLDCGGMLDGDPIMRVAQKIVAPPKPDEIVVQSELARVVAELRDRPPARHEQHERGWSAMADAVHRHVQRIEPDVAGPSSRTLARRLRSEPHGARFASRRTTGGRAIWSFSWPE